MLTGDFFVFPEEVHRIGSASNHRLSTIRPTEVNLIELNGVMVVVANGRGVSLYTLDKVLEEKLSGFAWKFEKGTQVVQGLKLVNDKPGHYMLTPLQNMPLEKYKGLLEEMGIKCSKYLKIGKDGKAVQV